MSDKKIFTIKFNMVYGRWPRELHDIKIEAEDENVVIGKLPALEPEKDGFRFVGWGAKESDAVPRIFSYPIESRSLCGPTRNECIVIGDDWTWRKYLNVLSLSDRDTIILYAQYKKNCNISGRNYSEGWPVSSNLWLGGPFPCR